MNRPHLTDRNYLVTITLNWISQSVALCSVLVRGGLHLTYLMWTICIACVCSCRVFNFSGREISPLLLPTWKLLLLPVARGTRPSQAKHTLLAFTASSAASSHIWWVTTIDVHVTKWIPWTHTLTESLIFFPYPHLQRLQSQNTLWDCQHHFSVTRACV